MKENDDAILGCFVSGPALYPEYIGTETQKEAKQRGEAFTSYIWGPLGIRDPLSTLKRQDYGKDLQLVLFQFYVLPLIEELAVLKDIGRYRPKERSVGIPVIIHDENFFNRSDFERRKFLKDVILEKLDLLARVVKRNKLDTNIELLRSDVEGLSF
jgi:hypothetical protein